MEEKIAALFSSGTDGGFCLTGVTSQTRIQRGFQGSQSSIGWRSRVLRLCHYTTIIRDFLSIN